jgi:hypothetical protein
MVAAFTNAHVVNFDHRGHRPEYSRSITALYRAVIGD